MENEFDPKLRRQTKLQTEAKQLKFVLAVGALLGLFTWIGYCLFIRTNSDLLLQVPFATLIGAGLLFIAVGGYLAYPQALPAMIISGLVGSAVGSLIHDFRLIGGLILISGLLVGAQRGYAFVQEIKYRRRSARKQSNHLCIAASLSTAIIGTLQGVTLDNLFIGLLCSIVYPAVLITVSHLLASFIRRIKTTAEEREAYNQVTIDED
ncbi:MAG: hypothetical protein V1738_02555 [Patescibacteria group bacterium]